MRERELVQNYEHAATIATIRRGYDKKRVDVFAFMRPDFARILRGRQNIRPSKIGPTHRAATPPGARVNGDAPPSHEQILGMFRRAGWPVIDARKTRLER